MIERIRRYFEQNIAPAVARTPSGADDEHPYQLATAALLIEMSRADFAVEPIEREAVVRAIQEAFGLARTETDDLLELAELEADDATSLYQFTRLINDRFDVAQKQRVVRMLWEVAYADGEADRYEQHLVRKIADLIHLPHRAYIAAKLDAEAARGAPSAGAAPKG